MNNHPLFIAALAEVDAIARQVSDAATDVQAHLMKKFNDAGGCSVCRGRGWVVVWDTLDSLSGAYAEYGKCTNPDCTPETRAVTGLAPVYNRYDRNRGIERNPMESSSEWAALVEPLQKVHAAALASLEDIRRRLTPAKGKEARVVKGRKVPIGTRGEIIWIGDGAFGRRVGLKDEAGKVHWTSVDNVEVSL